MIMALSDELSGAHNVHILVNDWDAVRRRTNQAGVLTTHSLRLRSLYDAKRPLAGFLGWFRDLPSTMRQLERLTHSQAIDVVHLHFPESYQIYFRILRMFGGPPYVVTLHRGDTVNFSKLFFLDRLLIRWTLHGATRVIAVSNWLARLAEQVLPERNEIICVHNGLTLPDSISRECTTTRRDLPIELPKDYFVNVANVSYYKGQDIAIRAWNLVRDHLPNVHLVIVGEPLDHWDACEELIQSLGLRERVHMLGRLPQEHVFAIMSGATGMVFPSRSEGLPYALLEAGALGVPVICSAILPLLEVAEDGKSALVVAPEDCEALAEAVVKFVNNASLRKRLAQALHNRVLTEFTSESMANRYLAIYREALRG